MSPAHLIALVLPLEIVRDRYPEHEQPCGECGTLRIMDPEGLLRKTRGHFGIEIPADAKITLADLYLPTLSYEIVLEHPSFPSRVPFQPPRAYAYNG